MHILEVAGLSPTWRRALLAGTKICGRLFVRKKLKWLIFFTFGSHSTHFCGWRVCVLSLVPERKHVVSRCVEAIFLLIPADPAVNVSLALAAEEKRSNFFTFGFWVRI